MSDENTQEDSNEESELAIGLLVQDNGIVLQLSNTVDTILMTPENAALLGHALIDGANAIKDKKIGKIILPGGHYGVGH